VTEDNVGEIDGMLKEQGLACVSIIPDLFSQKRWGNGSFAAKDENIRRQAMDETRQVARIATTIG
jgi:hypothetical protein